MTTTLPLAQVCCAPLLDGPLSADAATRLAAVFKAVAEPARLRLLSLIAAQPDGEACTCDLTEPVGLSQPTVSHHLKVPLDAGFLARDKRGQWSYYRIVPEQLAALRRPRAAGQERGMARVTPTEVHVRSVHVHLKHVATTSRSPPEHAQRDGSDDQNGNRKMVSSGASMAHCLWMRITRFRTTHHVWSRNGAERRPAPATGRSSR